MREWIICSHTRLADTRQQRRISPDWPGRVPQAVGLARRGEALFAVFGRFVKVKPVGFPGGGLFSAETFFSPLDRRSALKS